MTCIAGLIHEGKVYIGGDSAGVAGLDIVVRKDPKVFKVITNYAHSTTEAIFGFTSSFRMGQILMMHLELPEYSDEDPYIFVVTEIIPEIIKAFKENKYLKNSEEGDAIGGTFLIGFKGRLFYIDSDFQVGEGVDEFDACGCGEAYARTTIAVLKKYCPDMPPEDMITEALRLSEYYSGGVRGPFNIVSL